MQRSSTSATFTSSTRPVAESSALTAPACGASQRAEPALQAVDERADVTRDAACRPITGDPTAEPARDRHVFGEVNDSLGLDLCAHLVRQLADPQQLSQKDSHVQ